MYHILIDPGHGGPDPGAVSDNDTPADKTDDITEAQIALAVGVMLLQMLMRNFPGIITPHMTRFDGFDKKLTLAERGDMARKLDADLVLHLHVNAAANPLATGLQTFYLPESPEAEDVAKTIARSAPTRLHRAQNAAKICLDIPDYKRARNVLGAASPTPAVLVEMGFLTNPTDRHYLSKPAVQRSLAWALGAGVCRFLEIRSEAGEA
jgi:N-acetylmuramoyl-L-alanine amidase